MIHNVEYVGENIVSYTYATKADVQAKYGSIDILTNMRAAGADTFAKWIAPEILKAGPEDLATIDEIRTLAKVNFQNLIGIFEYNEKNEGMKDWADWVMIARAVYISSEDPSGRFKIYKLNTIDYNIDY